MKLISLLLADDHTLFRQSLATLLERNGQFEVLGQASDGNEAIEKARQLRPDIVLMDLSMPRCDGLQATRFLKMEMPDVKIIILTVSEKDDDLFAAVRAGARGYLLKNIDSQDFVRSILTVHSGDAIMAPRMASKLLDEFALLPTREAVQQKGTAVSGLTERETEILRLVVKGLSNKDIADSLCLSEATVKTHLRNTLDKLHVHNKVQAVAYAIRTGIDAGDPASR